MEHRVLGKTGQSLSVIGFGGIVVMNQTPEEAARFVGEAVDAGIDYFDVAPSYGNAEERLGPALEPYRDKVFLACKTAKRDKDGAALELRQSLARLKTNHIDLYQLHALTTDEDVDKAFGPGGVVEELVEAKQLGLVRFLGFSAHSEKAALAALEKFPFDSVLFPMNYFTSIKGNFGNRILAETKARGLGRLALKTLALGKYVDGDAHPFGKCWYQPLNDAALVRAAVRWTLAQGMTSCVTPGHVELLRLAIQAAQDIAEPEPDELAKLAAALGDRPPVFVA
ncbi:MAG: aldo/keto reductase [Armatimonadetes bacterium]|nr:aldo/keto reductase [Armatimonadota bacterium]